MSDIEKLMRSLIPKGVQEVTLGSIATISSSGVDKKSHADQITIRLLNYMDVYKAGHISSAQLSMTVTATAAKVKNCNILKGDLFITPSSETVDDIGHAAVAVEDIPDGVYSYHIHRIRFHNLNEVNPNFIRHLFSSTTMQNQIKKHATGMTRFGLTKSRWEGLFVPVPPMEIQDEIVSILDNFRNLEAELELELESRRKQYEYYRDKLLTFKELDSA